MIERLFEGIQFAAGVIAVCALLAAFALGYVAGKDGLAKDCRNVGKFVRGSSTYACEVIVK